LKKYLLASLFFIVVTNVEAKLDITELKSSVKVAQLEEETNIITLINGRRMQPGGGSSGSNSQDKEDSFWDQVIELFS
jgi:hypothetical protein